MKQTEIERGERQHRCIKNNKSTRKIGEIQRKLHKGMNIKQVERRNTVCVCERARDGESIKLVCTLNEIHNTVVQ